MYTLPIYCLHWNIKWIIKCVISEGGESYSNIDQDRSRIKTDLSEDLQQLIKPRKDESKIGGNHRDRWNRNKAYSRFIGYKTMTSRDK